MTCGKKVKIEINLLRVLLKILLKSNELKLFVKHVDELKVLLAQFSFDILANNETKLDESIKSSELHIPGYEFIRRDRNRHGGGIGFYIVS